MAAARMMVCDIDGTLLDDGAPTAGLETLRLVLRLRPAEVRLVYATGRSIFSVRNLVRTGLLPAPGAVAPMVGTEVWIPPWERHDPGYQARIAEGWDRDAAVRAALAAGGVRLQPDKHQTPWKASFFLDEGFDRTRLVAALRAAGVGARVILSGGDLLDLLPEHAGKRQAVEYLRRRWGVPRGSVLVAGDSGNDLDMLGEPGYLAVAVGNAEEILRKLDGDDTFHHAALPFAAGVLEGAEAFGFWARRACSRRRDMPW